MYSMHLRMMSKLQPVQKTPVAFKPRILKTPLVEFDLFSLGSIVTDVCVPRSINFEL